MNRRLQHRQQPRPSRLFRRLLTSRHRLQLQHQPRQSFQSPQNHPHLSPQARHSQPRLTLLFRQLHLLQSQPRLQSQDSILSAKIETAAISPIGQQLRHSSSLPAVQTTTHTNSMATTTAQHANPSPALRNLHQRNELSAARTAPHVTPMKFGVNQTHQPTSTDHPDRPPPILSS